VMIAAVVIAVAVMMFSAGPISAFVERHPTVKMLALAFLIMIGVSLIADGLGQHIPKGYIYFAMAFSVAVEVLNQRAARVAGLKREPVELKRPRPPIPAARPRRTARGPGASAPPRRSPPPGARPPEARPQDRLRRFCSYRRASA